MWTENVTRFSNEEGKKGPIEVGQLADLIVPDRDYFSCAEADIADATLDLTMVGGKVVYAAGDFRVHDDAVAPPAMPDWSPVRAFGGYGAWGEERKPASALRMQAAHHCSCQQLHDPRPRSCHRLVGQASDLGPQELLRRTRLRLLGGLIRK